ncbi:NUDIX hydrolase [Arthrobacter echini]|uniref:NUDIX hydrolase n=1 Tax=Arthrobacter echini TaxID=1529066 RepID=A0A4S5EA09_9MICC|nr:NUDIX hydrolase [Arthrobacter echini]THJ68430.1 NUDIX hydrolase [Arthrobacter echini]
MDRLSTRLFPVPPDQRTAAQSWIDHGQRKPLEARPASSVVLLRDTATGTETFLTCRRGQSPLGVIGFPGGSIEESDDDDVPWYGPSSSTWAKLLGVEDHRVARRHVLCAIRELFEETGVLLAGPDASSLVEGTQVKEWVKAREALANGEATFAEVLGRRGLGVRTDLIKPLSHWLTPDFAHRRFDTHYFAAAQPLNQEPSILGGKGVWGQWRWAAQEITDRDTTALGDAVGEASTMGRTLGELAVPAVELILEKIGSSRGCVAYLSHKRPVTVYHPELAEQDGNLMLQVACPRLTEGGSTQRGR